MRYQIHQSFLTVQDSAGTFFLLQAHTPMYPYHYQLGGHMHASLKSTQHENQQLSDIPLIQHNVDITQYQYQW